MRAIYTGCVLDPWMEVAEKLKNEQDIEPIYWIGWNKNGEEEKVKDMFPNIIFQDLADSWRGIFASEAGSFSEAILDGKFLKENAFHEMIAIKMMDRMDPDQYSFNFSERQRHYRRLLSKWMGIIDTIKPDLIISPSIPHRIFDYALYVAAKSRGINFIMYKMTNIPGLLIPMNDIFALPPRAYKYSDSNFEYEDLSSEAKYQINKMMQNYNSGEPEYMAKNKKTQDYYGILSLLRDFLNRPLKYIRFIISVFNVTKTGLKKKSKKIESSNFSLLEVEIIKWRGRWYKKRLKRYYESLVEKPDFEKKYILVALHYQPEETSTPSGGIYTDQFLMISMLSKTIPPDWHVYVKEHKSQFHPLFEGETGRNSTFYDDIIDLKNTRLISVDYDPFELIDKSEAVVTLTGTAGIEAIIRGKPVLTFGNAWYSPIKSVFPIMAVQDLEDAISEIKKGIVVEIREVYKYLAHLEKKIGFYAYHYKGRKEVLKITKKESVELLSRSIVDNLQI